MNADGPTKDELYERATELDIQGRSDMTKDELERAISEETDGTTAAASGGPTKPVPAPADRPGEFPGEATPAEPRAGIPAAVRSASRVHRGAASGPARRMQERREARGDA